VDSSNLCSGKSKSVTVVVTDAAGRPIRRTFTILPDFHNAMSYYYPCGTYHFSQQQINRMRSTLLSSFRRTLVQGIIGVGTDYNLYTRATLNRSWVGPVAASCCVTGVTELKDGTIVGIGFDQFLWTKTSLSAGWVQVPNSGWVTAISKPLFSGSSECDGTDATSLGRGRPAPLPRAVRTAETGKNSCRGTPRSATSAVCGRRE
jgi:hypothetical protein